MRSSPPPTPPTSPARSPSRTARTARDEPGRTSPIRTMPDRQATCQNEPRHFVRHAPMTDPSQTDEQQMIRDAVARFLDRAGGLAPARRIADVGPGRDMALWSGMVGELGLSGIVLPAAEGGLGLGMTELVLIQAELGRRLAPVPFLSTVGIAGAVLS
ncbi:MAG: acyl-CoA dehydrogenase family protein, partial [Rhodospirillales bacterium]